MSAPALVTVTLLAVIDECNGFIWPLIVTNSDAMRTVLIGLLFLKADEGVDDWGAIMAGDRAGHPAHAGALLGGSPVHRRRSGRNRGVTMTMNASLTRRRLLGGLAAAEVGAGPSGCAQFGVDYRQPSGGVPPEFRGRTRVVFWSAFGATSSR